MRVGVYGLGRFGSFWARVLARHAEVRAWSRDSSHPAPPGVTLVGEDEVLREPAVFFCVAISAFEEVLLRTAPRIPSGTLVMDTCSVKSHPAALMERLLAPGVSVLATHPMFGPDSAAAEPPGPADGALPGPHRRRASSDGGGGSSRRSASRWR